MQLQTFKVITLVTEIPTASSDVDIHLEPNIESEFDEMKICVPKLNKAHQYTSLTLNVAMWTKIQMYGPSTAAIKLLPKPVPSDWRTKPQEWETATLGPAHYLCFAMSNGDNR